MDAAWKQIVIGAQPGDFDPGGQSGSRWLCNLELHWSGGLFLHHYCASGDAVDMGDIANLYLDEIASP